MAEATFLVRPLAPASDPSRLAWVPTLESPFFNWTAELFASELSKARVWVLELSTEDLGGLVALRSMGNDLEITLIAIHPLFQGKGLGRALLKQVLRIWGQGQSILLEVHAKNERALRLYKSLQFKEVGRRKKYYRDGGDALVLKFGDSKP